MNNILKYATIYLFFGFIFIVPISTLLTPDKKVNEIENKILTQMPRLSWQNITSKRFMDEFDKYTADQFPLRTNFLEVKNSYNYIIGQKEFRDIYISNDGRLLEKFVFNNAIVEENISQVINIADDLKNLSNISSTLMVVPTSIAFYDDSIPSWAITDNQQDALEFINSMVEPSNLNFYNPYDVLYSNKDRYIYFYTDHHWTQLGAKLVYEDMFNTTVADNKTKVADDFYGTYYSKALLPFLKGDEIFAYEDFSDFSITIDFTKEYDTLYDDSKLDGKNKYQYFLYGDPAIAVIEGNNDSSKEVLIFKDSFAHNFVPFLAQDFRRVHIIDPRYYNIDLEEYLHENSGITDAIFINNIQTLTTSIIYK